MEVHRATVRRLSLGQRMSQVDTSPLLGRFQVSGVSGRAGASIEQLWRHPGPWRWVLRDVRGAIKATQGGDAAST